MKHNGVALTMEGLCKIIGAETPDAMIDRNGDAWMCDIPRSTLRETAVDELEDDASEDDIEERIDALAMKVEEDAATEAYTKYRNAVVSVAAKLFEEHGLTLIDNEENDEFSIEPSHAGATGWYRAAKKIIETINGYGMFEYTSVRDFFVSNSDALLQDTVISHLHWMKEWYAVYGEPNATHRIDRAIR